MEFKHLHTWLSDSRRQDTDSPRYRSLEGRFDIFKISPGSAFMKPDLDPALVWRLFDKLTDKEYFNPDAHMSMLNANHIIYKELHPVIWVEENLPP